MANQRSSDVPLQGMTASTTYRRDLVEKILGKPGKYPAYFRVYDELFDVGRADYLAEHQSQYDPAPINHAAILTATQRLKNNSTLSLQEIRGVLSGDLHIQSKLRIDSIITLATQAMLMADVNIRAQHMPNYSLGNYYHPEWRDDQSLIEFITSCFVKVSPAQEGNVVHVLEDRASLTAGNLSSRVGLRFKGTNNIADHLLLDTGNLTLYFFHHAEYIRAHLGTWGGINSAKTASLEEALKKFEFSLIHQEFWLI
ncbi:hypothetical protein E8E14_014221 [Neopestalotiopsis sp. 37M]|nr:hypothetical protein E8E14_014221 [Neopestalotiopsis sp. 37M]